MTGMKFALLVGSDHETLVTLGRRGYSVIRVEDAAAAARAAALHRFDVVIGPQELRQFGLNVVDSVEGLEAVAEGQTTTNLFDPDTLHEYANGDRQEAKMVMDYFLLSAEKALAAIDLALRGQDTITARVHAHGLSNHCVCVGAQELGHALGRLEQSGSTAALRDAWQSFVRTRQAMAGKR